jgi:hypothetical protein
MALKLEVSKTEDIAVVRCRGRIVFGEEADELRRAIASIELGQMSARASRSVYPSCESKRESAHNPTCRAVQIERSKWSNVIRHLPWPLL